MSSTETARNDRQVTRPGPLGVWAALGLCSLHSLAIWTGLGGIAGLSGPWPLARHDHPLYFHSALVTRAFLAQSGTTAGYDPSFMAGYPKSVIYPASSTLPELVIAGFGGSSPARAYKVYVFLAAAAVPWLIVWAGCLWGARGDALAIAVFLFLAYFWTDFPIQYATFGMLPYLVSIPFGLVALAFVTRFLERGGLMRWAFAALSCSVLVLVHFTAAMVVAPAAFVAYLAAVVLVRRDSGRFSVWRHLGVWVIPAVVLALNAFWWWPGIPLASTKGDSSFAFSHPEGVLARLSKIVTGGEPPIQVLLWAFGTMFGIAWLRTRTRSVVGFALAAWLAAGAFWGYAAGAWRELDFLQPGRHTFAFYTGLALLTGMGCSGISERITRGWLRPLPAVGLVAIVLGMCGPGWIRSIAVNLSDPLPWLTRLVDAPLSELVHRARPEPFLSSRPTPRWRWVVNRVKAHVQPGERLLYEESGFGLPGLSDPFEDGRLSGLIPYFVPGVELLGGPYLHAALTTNFTQFGEGRLFGAADWDREHFVRHARLYRPSAMLCWTPHARAFCLGNPDLIEIREDDGRLMLARVKGFGGDTIQGQARVEAHPGRLIVSDLSGELDELVVLRYHFVPHLQANPGVRIEPVPLEGDPVPFIGLRVSPATRGAVIELRLVP